MSLTDRFFGDGNGIADRRGHPQVVELEEIFERQRTKGRGIAALPRSDGGAQYFYLFAWTPDEGRELRDLARAWIGPALSDVHLSSLELDRSDPFDRDVARMHPGVVIKLQYLPERPPASTPQEEQMLRERSELRRSRLLLMLRLLDERPASEFLGGRDTGTVLRDLALAIGSGDERMCEELLGELERTGDLDEVNLAFQRVRVLGGLRRWRSIVELPSLPDLLALRRPPGVSRLIEEALYQSHLVDLDLAGDDDALVARFAELEHRLPGIGSRSPSPATRGQAIVQYLQATAVSTDRPWADRILLAAEQVDSYLAERLRRFDDGLPAVDDRSTEVYVTASRSSATPADRVAIGDLEGAVRAVDAAGAASTGVDLGHAIEAAVDLGVPDIAERILKLLEAHRAAAGPGDMSAFDEEGIARLERIVEDVPRSWTEWFDRCSSAPSTTDALRWLESAGEWAPLGAGELLGRLATADERLLASLPVAAGPLIDAHLGSLLEADQHTLLSDLMLAMAVSGVATPSALAQCFRLLSLAVDRGAPAERLATMLEAVGVVSENAYPSPEWIVDVLELVAWSSLGHDDPAVVQFEHRLLDALRRTRRTVHGHAAERWRDLASESALAGPPTTAGSSEVDLVDLRCLAGQRIGIYSLDERSANSVRAHVERVAPGADVRLSHDLKATKPLKDLAQNSDILLVVTTAATHSATDAIKAARRGGRTEYVNANGASALIDALSRYCSLEDPDD